MVQAARLRAQYNDIKSQTQDESKTEVQDVIAIGLIRMPMGYNAWW